MERSNFEKLRVYRLSEKLADELWKIVIGWNYFERDTVGKQLVRAGDSIGANIAEGTGRGRFLVIAPMLNAYLNSIGVVRVKQLRK